MLDGGLFQVSPYRRGRAYHVAALTPFSVTATPLLFRQCGPDDYVGIWLVDNNQFDCIRAREFRTMVRMANSGNTRE